MNDGSPRQRRDRSGQRALGAACRKITAVALGPRDVASVAAVVRAMETLIDEVRTTFRHDGEVVNIADDLERGLRDALWAEAEVTRQ